jgi:hypothetical protein
MFREPVENTVANGRSYKTLRITGFRRKQALFLFRKHCNAQCFVNPSEDNTVANGGSVGPYKTLRIDNVSLKRQSFLATKHCNAQCFVRPYRNTVGSVPVHVFIAFTCACVYSCSYVFL